MGVECLFRKYKAPEKGRDKKYEPLYYLFEKLFRLNEGCISAHFYQIFVSSSCRKKRLSNLKKLSKYSDGVRLASQLEVLD